ncbi:MAG TPA: hypothetical protein VNQ77_02345 [Frankiaceae bacterium]|nr:hypothetical protein [Frankiaceae bacterium]
MSRRLSSALSVLVLGAGLAVVQAAPAVAAAAWPDVIALPNGYRPEGIAGGTGTTFYVGSIPTGAVRVGDYRTGVVDELVPAQSGRAAIGLKYDRGLLWVAGGPTGKAFVYDATTGDDVAVHTLTTAATFVNDVVLTRDAAYFTDSVNPVLYRIARNPDGSPGALTVLPLTGDLVYTSGFNVNGIAATPDGTTLFVVQSNKAALYVVDAATGVTTLVPLTDPAGGTESLVNADGILLDGRTVYVVQNRGNAVAEVLLAPDYSSGVVVSRTQVAAFQVPTTIAEHGSSLYAVNARFGVSSPDTASYGVVRLAKP